MKQSLCLHPCCVRYRVPGHKYCEKHMADEDKDIQRKKEWLEKKYQHRDLDSDKAKYYRSARWKKLRSEHLKEFPFCEMCGGLADEVHHNYAPGYNYHNDEDFYNPQALVSLCKKCHAKETSARMGRR